MGEFKGEQYRGFRIKEIWAFVTIDKQYDDEGVVGIMSRTGWTPLIAADEVRLRDLMPYVQEIANDQGQPIQVVKFTNREFIQEFTPQAGGDDVSTCDHGTSG